MAVTHNELVGWARDCGVLIAQSQTAIGHISIFQAMYETAARQPNEELREALRHVALEGLWGKSFLPAMRDYPDTFDGWFIAIMTYGLLYDEFDRVLLRFADKPEELTMDYFGPTGGVCLAPPERRDAVEAEYREQLNLLESVRKTLTEETTWPEIRERMGETRG